MTSFFHKYLIQILIGVLNIPLVIFAPEEFIQEALVISYIIYLCLVAWFLYLVRKHKKTGQYIYLAHFAALLTGYSFFAFIYFGILLSLNNMTRINTI